jgi:hypothetical protein
MKITQKKQRGEKSYLCVLYIWGGISENKMLEKEKVNQIKFSQQLLYELKSTNGEVSFEKLK